jgi:hydroxymethylglutaryl-CoA lyase
MGFASHVKIVEVGPRDGLQNEPETITTDDKITFVNLLSDAGLPHLEVTSFVSPRWVPQLADGAEVFQGIAKRDDAEYSALVPNMYGLERALKAGVRRISIFTAASETFNQHNINASIDESLERFKPVMARAQSEGIWVRGYVSTSFGCPYDGDIPAENVVRVARALDELGVHEISLGDTHGAAVPSQVPEVVGGVLEHVPVEKVAVHFHDTHGRALANVYSALQLGIGIIDSSAGGLGGCPYAPGASGNLATEDLVVMLSRMKIETGVDLNKLMKASRFMEGVLERRLPSRHLLADACGISKTR